MEDLGQLLPLLLGLLVAIISGLNKRKKKVTENTKPIDNDPFDDIFRKFIPQDEEEDNTVEVKKELTVDKTVNSNELNSIGLPVKQDNTNNKIKNSEIGKTSKTNSIDDFDLRKAIIYSELMKPKFKE